MNTTSAMVRNGRLDTSDPLAGQTTIGSGFPVFVAVTGYTPGQAPYRGGHPDTWEPGFGEEIETELFLIDGRPAPTFVQNMVTQDDDQRLRDLASKLIEATADYY